MATEECRRDHVLAYEAYAKHRELLVRGLYEEMKGFDKAILTLGSGALGLSLVFVRYVSPHPIGWTVWVLAFAWASFTSSLVCALIGFLAAQASHRDAIVQWDDIYASYPANEECPPAPKYAALTSWLGIAAATFFIVGVIALVLFCIPNLSNAANEGSANGNEQEARQIREAVDITTKTKAGTAFSATEEGEGRGTSPATATPKVAEVDQRGERQGRRSDQATPGRYRTCGFSLRMILVSVGRPARA